MPAGHGVVMINSSFNFASPFTPPTIGGLQLWIDADDASTFTLPDATRSLLATASATLAIVPAADLDDLLSMLGWDRPDWYRDAACREHPELSWFPATGVDQTAQKAICAACLVRSECLAGGADESGIWGGQSERARRRLRIDLTAA